MPGVDMVSNPAPHSVMEDAMLYLQVSRSSWANTLTFSPPGNSSYIPDDFKKFLIGYAQSARNGFKYWRSEAYEYDHVQQKSYCWGQAYDEIEFYKWIKGVVADYLDGYIDTDALIDRSEYLWENRDYGQSEAIDDLLKLIFSRKGVEWHYRDEEREDTELDRDEYYESLYRG